MRSTIGFDGRPVSSVFRLLRIFSKSLADNALSFAIGGSVAIFFVSLVFTPVIGYASQTNHDATAAAAVTRFSIAGARMSVTERVASTEQPARVKAATADQGNATTGPSDTLSSRTTAERLGKAVRLPGHVLPILSKATLIGPMGEPGRTARASQRLILTIVLKRADQASFERYLRDVYDAHSPEFRRFLTQREIVDRFGPRRQNYDSALAYLRANGFELVQGSSNRLTLMVSGTREQVERAFQVHIRDYRLGEREFYANDDDPAMPETIASEVQAVTGLANLAKPDHRLKIVAGLLLTGACSYLSLLSLGLFGPIVFIFFLAFCFQILLLTLAYGAYALAGAIGSVAPASTASVVPAGRATGKGQTIGLIEFDSFQTSDVANFLNLFGVPNLITNLTRKDVNGGAGLGPNQDEVLLDIDNVLLTAPGAKVVVYDGPFTGPGTSFQALFNDAIDGGSTVISNSWAYCEDQTTLSDVQSIDSIFQNAALQGISVFNATGDSGSTCLDDSPNTVSVPADSPNATAVGGSSLTTGPGFTYLSETWWNASNGNPPTGQGGFGVSKFFPAKAYQIRFSGNSMRSVPDVVLNADPAHGVMICQASNGGCPSGKLYGGTSSAAPVWAAFAALLNQDQGKNLGLLNPQIYMPPIAQSFHGATSMKSDFAHVGLGSPNLGALALALAGITGGQTNSTTSQIAAFVPNPLGFSREVSRNVPADGATQGHIVVYVLDASNHMVRGKTVTLRANAGSHVKITPTSGVSSIDNGTVTFNVTDLTAEDVTFTAIDTTDGVVLKQTAKLPFVTPSATGSGIEALPSTVTANGVNTASIIVTLKDSLGRPTPGKLIDISQAGGHSIIKGPSPALTDSSGKVMFTAVDQVDENVTYSATDVTDGNLPFPGMATVSFISGPNNGCGTANPVAAPGFQVTPYATGFLQQSFSFQGVSAGCAGAFGMAFDAHGNLFVADQPTGNIYKFPPGGGVTGAGTLLTKTAIGPSLIGLVIDKDGNLFAGRNATTGALATGVILQINPSTGDTLREVASGLTCPGLISLDPLSGDIFADDNCFGGGLNNPSLWRVSKPDSTSPKTSVYATLPVTPDGTEAFAPNGTVYVTLGNGQLARVTGTNGPSPPSVSTVPSFTIGGLGLLAKGTQPDGDAQSVIGNFAPSGSVPGGIGMFDLTTDPPSMSATLLTDNSAMIGLVQGPDGCLYGAQGDAVFKITDDKGACKYAPATQPATLTLTPTNVSPNPAQGPSQSFTASFHYISVPDGTPIFFQVTGANPQFKLVRASSGQASFSYTGTFTGIDTITASATVGTKTLTSNQAVITWTVGQHTSFLTLNLSPTSVRVGKPVKLIASLSDVSVTPPARVPGASIQISLEGNSCFGTTDAKGNASCTLTPTFAELTSQTATFAGNSALLPATATQQFNVTAPPTFVPTVTPKATATRKPTPRPTRTPSRTPTRTATRKPTPMPTHSHTATATRKPTPTPTPIPFVNFGVAVVGDDGTGTTHGLQVMRIEDRTGKVLPTPQQTYVPLTSSADIDGLSITSDGTHGAVIDGGNLVHFFSSDLATGAVTVLPATVNVSSFGGDGDSIASLPGGDEVVVSAGGKTAHALISGVLSGKPVIAESIPTSRRGVEYNGVVISADGKVMLSRAGAGKLLDVYSVTAVKPHPGPLAGTVAFSFSLIKTLTVPAATSLDGREGMAISPINSSRAVLAGSDGSVSLITGLPLSPVIGKSIKLSSGGTAVAISRDGKFAIVAISGGLVVLKGVDTGTLTQVCTVYSPTFPTPNGSCKLGTGKIGAAVSPMTLGVMADGKFVVTIQDCGLPRSKTNVGAGVLLTVPFSGGTLGKPVGQLNFVVTPSNDQLLTH